jgi:hypothetical protein
MLTHSSWPAWNQPPPAGVAEVLALQLDELHRSVRYVPPPAEHPWDGANVAQFGELYVAQL